MLGILIEIILFMMDQKIQLDQKEKSKKRKLTKIQTCCVELNIMSKHMTMFR